MVLPFLDVEGAATLPTESLLMVDLAVTDLIRVQAMGTVHGPAGLGKTYAVEQTLSRATASGLAGRAPCWVKFPSRPTMRLVAAALLAELTRVLTGRGNRFVLTEALVEELAPPPGGGGHVLLRSPGSARTRRRRRGACRAGLTANRAAHTTQRRSWPLFRTAW